MLNKLKIGKTVKFILFKNQVLYSSWILATITTPSYPSYFAMFIVGSVASISVTTGVYSVLSQHSSITGVKEK